MSTQNELSKEDVLLRAADFFRESIANGHIRNLKKLKKLSSFTYNPFLLEYLAIFVGGKANAENMAKALVYPRILGTSINTSFGSNVQRFCSAILPGFGSGIPGIDLEFIDKVDGRRKYCQVKAGPNTINYDDIATIDEKFKKLKNKARLDNLELGLNDLVVGLLYGTDDELSGMYTKLKKDYVIYAGKDFWHRLTGDEGFYLSLIKVFGEVAKETDVKDILEDVIQGLAKEVEDQVLSVNN